MKKLLIIFFILFSINGYSQNTVPQFLGGKNSNLIIQGILNLADSAKASMNWLLSDTNTTKSNFSSNLKGRWARQGGRLYYNPSGTRFIFADSVTSSTTIDTTSLSNRIDARVKYTDTAAMLNPYARKTLVADTAAAIRSSIPNVSGKVNYTDTATMLVPYLRKADTVSLSNRINLKLNTSDTSAMLSPYYRSATATAALALKQNYTDTTTWDATKKNLADTALALRALIPTSIDTTSLSNRIDARVKYTDTASMLVGYVRAARLNDTASAIRSSIPNVSGKVNYTDTSAMLTPYLRKGDTTAMLLPYARKTLVNDTAAAIRASIPNVSGKVNYTDTAAMLTGYVRANRLSDTASAIRSSIPNVSGKVNYTDTASMLAPYATDAQVALKLNITDTANMRIRPIAGSNMTISGTYPNITFAASSGTVIDTTSLSNRIDARVKYTDTAAMLGGYLRKVDTSTLSNRINAKLSIADTATMLTNYARKTLVNDTAAAIRASIPNVSGKVNYTDTASMLSPYLRSALGVKYADTASMLGGYLRKADTSSLSNRINLKFNTADTANNWVNSVVKLNDSTIRVTKNTTITDITLTPTSTVTSATRLITAVYNKSGATIAKGSVVYIDGAHSSVLPSIALAKANQESTSAYTYGLVENDIPNNSQGVVIQVGVITNLNLPTSTYTDGQTLYLSPTVAGGYTLVKPLAPNHYVSIGTITRAHPTLGTIQIAIRNGFQLDELSDVQIPLVPNDSDLLQFTRVDSLWKNVSVTTAIGNKYIKPSDTASMLTPYLRKADTASLSTRINLKLNSADTASLSNRINLKLNSADTSSLSTRIDARVKYTDTASMLSPYYRTATATAALVLKQNFTDTTSWDATKKNLADTSAAIRGAIPSISGKVNYTDTAAMLTPYLRKADTASLSNRINLKLNSADTASLSNRINLKLNSADTASLSTRIEARVKYTDTATMLSPYYRTATATSALATKVNYTDTATMLTPYLRKGDTASMLTAYARGQRLIDTAAAIQTRINLKANIASPTFTGTVTIPTGANITTPNVLSLTSGTTNDSIVVADATSGALKRISSSRIGSGISGLTTNYVTKATSATAIGNSQIFDDGTLVGIGTATPTTGFKLDVNGRLKATSINFGTSNTLNPTSTAHIIGESATIETGASYVSALGGFSNTVKSTSYISSILGGNSNTVSGTNNNIAASISVNMTGITGTGNQAVASNNSTIFAGSSARNSFIGANASFINTNKNDNIVIGYNIFAQHDGNFMLGDRASIGAGYLNSTADNRFMSRFQNGYDFKLANNVTALFINSTAQIGIGTTTPNASSILDLTSTTQGLLLPRMTTTQINAIASPAAGLTVYNTTLALICFYNGTAWQKVTATAM
jgi:hypothetical protein